MNGFFALESQVATSAFAASHETLCQGVFNNTLQPYVLESILYTFYGTSGFVKSKIIENTMAV